MKLNQRIWKRNPAAILVATMAFVACFSKVYATPLVIVETNDFSNLFGNPTQCPLQVGTNFIQGSASGNVYLTDNDYCRIILPDNSRLAGLTVKVTNFSGPDGSIGFFNVLPEEEGNTGSTAFVADATEAISFTIGTPGNIILQTKAPFAGFAGETFYNYEIQLIVAPIEVVAGTAIYTAVEVTFPSEMGQSYQLQYTSDLSSPAWVSVGAPMVGEGGTMSAFDSTRHAEQRFYRVVKQ